MPKVKQFVVAASLCAISLGTAREVYLFQFGADTLLLNMTAIAFDEENTLLVWYSSALLLANAFLLGAIAGLTRAKSSGQAHHWQMLAVIFVFLSIDETASFHELAISPVRNALGLTGFFYFSWVVPALALLVGFVIIYIPFLRRLPKRTAVQLMLSGAIYVGGALGVELIGGFLYSTAGQDSGAYILAASIEEILEIAGMSLLFVTLIDYLSDHIGAWSMSFEPKPR